MLMITKEEQEVYKDFTEHCDDRGKNHKEVVKDGANYVRLATNDRQTKAFGYLAYKHETKEDIGVDVVYIEPAARGRGYGTQLLKAEMDTHRKLYIKTYKQLIPYFTRLGFKSSGVDRLGFMRMEYINPNYKDTVMSALQYLRVTNGKNR